MHAHMALPTPSPHRRWGTGYVRSPHRRWGESARDRACLCGPADPPASAGRMCACFQMQRLGHGCGNASEKEPESESELQGRIQEGYACFERSTAEGIQQWAGRCHKGNATARERFGSSRAQAPARVDNREVLSTAPDRGGGTTAKHATLDPMGDMAALCGAAAVPLGSPTVAHCQALTRLPASLHVTFYSFCVSSLHTRLGSCPRNCDSDLSLQDPSGHLHPFIYSQEEMADAIRPDFRGVCWAHGVRKRRNNSGSYNNHVIQKDNRS
eukprot:355625-Chlamydomonas_euryale.AAC.3